MSEFNQQLYDKATLVKPVAYLMVNREFPQLAPSLHYEPKDDWHITWESVPLYSLDQLRDK